MYMPWNEPGGDKDPWSGKKKTSKGNPSDKVTELFSGMSGGGDNKKLLFLLPLIALALWVFAGVYTVNAGERGVVLQFGKFNDITDPGLHWIPVPINSVEIVDIKRIKTTKDQTTMLTKDENIVDLGVEVQYHVSDPKAYLFNVRAVDNERDQSSSVLYQVMRSAVREVVGSHDIDHTILGGREEIERKTSELMQTILDKYKTGLTINKMNLTYAEAPKDVKDAFDDANRAREDFDRLKNEAKSYANKVLPLARGKAARVVAEANAYKEQIVSKAEGEAARFTSLVAEYKKAPDVTRERLYIDTMEVVLAGSKKVMMDNKGGNNVFYLPLNTGSSSTTSTIPPPLPPQVKQKMDSLSKTSEQLRQSSRFKHETTTGSGLREGR
jgi:membrane protease subunit HflK